MKERLQVLAAFFLFAGGLGLSSLPALAAPGDGAYRVSVLELPLKSAPFGLSQSVKTLKYGDQVTLQEPAPPRSNPLNKPTAKNKKQSKDSPQPKWFKIVVDGTTGFVPVSSLIPESRFGKQNAGLNNSGDTAEAGRGFSESEDPDLAAVKGAAGSAEGSTADFEGLDKIVSEYPGGDKQESNREFRKKGLVGEFKQAEVKP